MKTLSVQVYIRTLEKTYLHGLIAFTDSPVLIHQLGVSGGIHIAAGSTACIAM